MNHINLSRRVVLAAFILTFAASATHYAHAQSASECRERVMNSIDNASKLGGTDADKMRWAQIAADDCVKERGTKSSSYSGNQSSDLGFGSYVFFALAFLVLSALIALAVWFAKMTIHDWTAIPLLDPKSPHREETERIIEETLHRLESSNLSANQKAARLEKFLSWRPLLETNNSWTIKGLQESIKEYII